jgi:LacI family transcriptional regulator
MADGRTGTLLPQNVTIKDVAEHLGVSHSTVSRALNDRRHISEEMKARVRQAAAELGYVVNAGARTLRSAESNLIGLIVPDVGSELFTAAAKALAARCFRAGYQLVLCVHEDDPEIELRHVEALRQARALGVVIIPTPGVLDQTAALLKATSVVQFSRYSPKIDAPSVTLDGAHGVATAVAHLASLGHRRIAYVGLPDDRSTGWDRLAGYRQGLERIGVAFDPGLVRLGATLLEYGRSAMASLLQLDPRPTAVVFGSADLTHGGVEACRRAGVRVPQDLSVVGYGDPAWFKLIGPGLTTVAVVTGEMAEAAILQLLRKIAGGPDEAAASIALEPHLILRESTAPLRA